jgi:hypothetical protein
MAMPYRDDRNDSIYRYGVAMNGSALVSFVVLTLLIVGGIVYAISDRGPLVASNIERSMPSTTGQGGTR